MNAGGEQEPGARGARDRPGLQALGDEIVRMATELQAKEAELVRLRARYEKLSKQRKGGERLK